MKEYLITYRTITDNKIKKEYLHAESILEAYETFKSCFPGDSVFNKPFATITGIVELSTYRILLDKS